MSEADGNSTARARDSAPVLRAAAVLTLSLAVATLPGSVRRALRAPAVTRAITQAPGRAVASVRGVVQREGGGPVEGARVHAVLIRDGRSWPVGDARTDGTGRYLLSPLPPGDVQLVVTATGRTRALLRLRVAGDETAPTLVLGEGARIEGSLVALRGEAREPIVGVTVRATREGGDELPFVARSGSDGSFSLDGLPAGGTWRVELDAPGHERVRRLGVLAPSRDLVLLARALATVEGIVRDAQGDGVAAASVTISGSGIWPARAVPLLHDGRFLLTDVPAGVYELRASHEEDVAEPVAPLVLEPGGRREVAMVLAPGGTVSGVVRDALSGGGVADARVVITEDSLSMAPRALRSDGGGRFRVAGLLRRPHQVAVYAPGYAPRQGIVAAEGTPVDVALDRGVTVDGRLVDGQGAPIANARIELLGEDLDGRALWWNGATVAFRDALFTAQVSGPRPLIARGELGVMSGRVPMVPLEPVPMGIEAERTAPGWTTDLDGRFHLTDVPPGIVRVATTHAAFVRAESEARTARPGESLDLALVAHAGGAVEGRVLTERGFPLSGAQVELRADSETAPRRVFTARDGTFRAAAVLGRVSIIAWVQGRVAARAEVTVADDTVSVVNLTVPGTLRRVEGRVVDARGFPVSGATLSITSLERAALGTVQTFSEADGTFDTVIGGTRGVTIEVRHPDHAPRGLRVDDPSHPLRIELTAGASLSVRVEADGCATGDGSAELRGACGPVRVDARDEETARFERLCPGRASLVVDIPGCMRVERSVNVPASGEIDLGRLELRAGGAAEGEVVDADGALVAGAVVSREGAAGEAGARTGRRGEFSLGALPEGDVALVASHPSLGTSRAVRVRVLRGTIARGVLLRMERSARDAGRVVPARAVTLDDGAGRAVLVRAVAAGSSAESAGVRPGDRVLSVSAEAVSSARDAERRMTGPPGDDVVLELERDGQRRTVRFVRESR